ncbi:SKP1-like protein 1B [Solanum stenotomum]|uniref:SKP1-like protein 1B n=1 Tax=Solanum stenotomum TaxID=172797 RepID=UPI0020D007E6|nr:SKP1-like protein 1B [Solanum stenotomum]
MSSEKFITFKTSDGKEFKLNERVAVRSEVIKNVWKKYSEEGVTEDQLKSFDQDFLKTSQLELVGVLLAANCFDDNQLKEIIIQEFADRIKGKPIEEIREVFGIVNDYTPEEEEEFYLLLFLFEEIVLGFE